MFTLSKNNYEYQEGFDEVIYLESTRGDHHGPGSRLGCY